MPASPGASRTWARVEQPEARVDHTAIAAQATLLRTIRGPLSRIPELNGPRPFLRAIRPIRGSVRTDGAYADPGTPPASLGQDRPLPVRPATAGPARVAAAALR